MIRLGFVVIASTLLLAACGATKEDRAISGGALGAGAGGAAAGLTGGSVGGGALLGGAAGAAGGALTDQSQVDLGKPVWRR
jgi:osmotically inducible lipoprotein OsmB